MRQSSLGFILALAVGLAVTPACAEQEAQFDPHDLSGYWTGPPPSERPPENSHPPYTEAGQQRMLERAPDYIEASNWPDEFGETPGCRTVSCRNDPMFSCNPMGFPRITWEENEVFEIVQLPDRIMHFYQWDRVLRELWMDGREQAVQPGDAVMAPPGTDHGFRNTGDETLKLLLIWGAPAGSHP